MNERRASQIAGWLFLIPAAAVIGIWYIYLFVAMPDNLTVWQSVVGQLEHTFSEANPQAWWFGWLAALPFLCIALAAAYLFNVGRTRAGALALLAATLTLAAATLLLTSWPLAVFVAFPALWGYRAIHAT